MTSYRLIRSNRKTIAIYVTKEADVEVRAPLKASKAEIDRFVTSKQSWIDAHLAMQSQSAQSKAAFALQYGDLVLMQGKEYPIVARDSNRIGFDGECFFVPPGLPSDEIRRALIRLYKHIAKPTLTNKVIDYAKRMGAIPIAVKINSAKTRWGSCSGKNSINFSWRLIMADDDVIDYVVVHELAHIKEHNHSERFWAIVASVFPDYKQRQGKLKLLQKRLAGEEWD